MPQYQARHRRAKDWGGESQPSRSQQVAAAAHDDPAKKRPPSTAKKGKCKGPDGWHAEHSLAFYRTLDFKGQPKGPCGWAPVQRWGREVWYEAKWVCNHLEKCSRCDHITRQLGIGQDCPDFHGQECPQAVIAECERRGAEAASRRHVWLSRRHRPGTPPAGPQGYRKPKKEAKPDGTS